MVYTRENSGEIAMRTIRRSSFTVSSFALAIGLLGSNPASAQTVPVPAPAPAPESCANIKNEEAKQACSHDAKRVDPLANQGETETSPTQRGVASAEATPRRRGEIRVKG